MSDLQTVIDLVKAEAEVARLSERVVALEHAAAAQAERARGYRDALEHIADCDQWENCTMDNIDTAKAALQSSSVREPRTFTQEREGWQCTTCGAVPVNVEQHTCRANLDVQPVSMNAACFAELQNALSAAWKAIEDGNREFDLAMAVYKAKQIVGPIVESAIQDNSVPCGPNTGTANPEVGSKQGEGTGALPGSRPNTESTKSVTSVTAALENIVWALDVPESEYPRMTRQEIVSMARGALQADWDAEVTRNAEQVECPSCSGAVETAAYEASKKFDWTKESTTASEDLCMEEIRDASGNLLGVRSKSLSRPDERLTKALAILKRDYDEYGGDTECGCDEYKHVKAGEKCWFCSVREILT